MTIQELKNHYAKVGQTFRSSIGLYRKYHNALSAKNHCKKPHVVVLGEEGDYLLVTYAVAERLVRAGYQYA